MQILKNIKSYLYSISNNTFIILSDFLLPLKGELKSNGFFKINEMISHDETLKLINYIENNFPDNELVLGEHEILKKIIFNNQLIKNIQKYLGRSFRLDNIELLKTKPNSISNSNLWHHDSVGHRLKLFIYLNDNDRENHIKTEYINKSHFIKRIRYSNSKVHSKDSRIKLNDLERFIDKNGTTMLCGKKGDGIIFDTNGLHRGYHPLIGEERLTLQFEFSSTFKGKFVRGQVGPRKDYRSLLGQG